MQKGLTWFLAILAVALFAFIYFFERKVPGSADRSAAPRVFATLEPRQVTALEITLPGSGVMRAEQTNGHWFLTRPLYPAQQAIIETFVTNVARLRRYDRIPPHEVALQGQKSFGLEPARAAVLVETATNRMRFEIGGPAPLTKNIYLRVEPSSDVIMVQADLLQSLAQSTNDWRSEKLIPLGEMAFDHIQVRNGQRIFELGRNPTNNLWQITKPIPARGDQDQIASLFEQLGKAQVGRFVADGTVDLDRYNLQTPQIEVGFSQGANRVFTMEIGGNVTNETNQVYGRLLGTTNIVTFPADLVKFLQQPYKAFHDPRLLTLNPNALDRITIHSLERFSIQRQPNGRWLVGENDPLPADPQLLTEFVRTMLSMRILDIAKEVPTEADLQTLGLLVPRVSYSFYEKHTNTAGVTTNILFSDVNFGSNLTDRIYVRRSDEAPVYVVPLAPLLELPHQAFRMRERQIWNFSTNDIVRLTLSSPGRTNTATHSNSGWAPDAVANAAIDEAAFRLSTLSVVRWVAKGDEAVKAAAITPESETLEVELRRPTGNEILRVQFGKQTLQHNVYARMPASAGEPIVFEFPGEIYHVLIQHLPAAK